MTQQLADDLERFLTGETFVEVASIQAGRFLLIGLAYAGLKPRNLLLATTAERLLWTVWIGYIATTFTLGFAHCLTQGAWQVEREFQLFPPLATVTGLAFFVLGSNYWGRCYAFGVLFQALALLMTFNLPLAPPELGASWGAVLTNISFHLRGLDKSNRG